MGIKEYDSSIYLAPNKHTVFVRINKSRFDDTSTHNISDISAVDLSNNNATSYSGVVVDASYSYYSPINSGLLTRIAIDNFTLSGTQTLDLASLLSLLDGFEGITMDNSYIYLCSANKGIDSNFFAVRVDKNNFTLSGVTIISLIDVTNETTTNNKVSGFGGITSDNYYIYIAPGLHNRMIRIDKNNFTVSGVNIYPVTNEFILLISRLPEVIVLPIFDVDVSLNSEYE